MAKFKKGQSGNPHGRPPVGQSFADRVRLLVGPDGAHLAQLWYAVAFRQFPDSTKVAYVKELKALSNQADVRDRLTCTRLLAERGFGQPKQEHEHSGEIAMPTTVIHEYHAASS